MTRAATAAELTKLRSHGQWAKWKLLIDDPDTIYTARATGAVDKSGGYNLGFDGGAGTLGNCLADMTILIGSTAGASDIGMTRLRKAPIAGTFYIGIDPSIESVDNNYITVLNDFAPWAKHPWGTSLDVDIAYSDQFSSFIPVAVWNERFAVIDAGDTISFSASDSWVPGSTISAYAWTFTGATSSTGTTTATPTATYNTSGRFRVQLVLTAANTKTSTSFGWVYVLGVNLSAETGTIISELEAETGLGWACQVTMYDRPTIKDRARAILYSTDYFDNVEGSAGPVTGRENILMVGWIIGETIVRVPGEDLVEFTIGGPGVFLSSTAIKQLGLIDTSMPTDSGTTVPAWSKMASLSVVKGMHYLINYRSTLAKILDIEVEDWSWPSHKVESGSENLWGQMTDFAGRGAMTVTSDRYGHIYIERDTSLYTLASRAANIPVIMNLSDADWTDELAIIRRQVGSLAMAEAEGTIFSGGIVTQVGGRAPGNNPAAHGDLENINEISFSTQANATELAGLMAGAANAEYEQVMAIHPSNNHFIDVAPRQYVTHTVDSDDLDCIPRRIVMHREVESGRVWLDLELEPAGGQWPAVAITYPTEGEEPVDPPIEPPDVPPVPPGDDGGGGDDATEASSTNAVAAIPADIQTTANLDAASPTWTTEL